MSIYELLAELIEIDGSDLHLLVNTPPVFRKDRTLVPSKDTEPLTVERANELITSILTKEQADYIRLNRELDFSLELKDQTRLRANVYFQRGSLAAAFRLIPKKIKTLEELVLPPVLHQLIDYPQGLVLLTGPTGEGKSTTLAALVDEINHLQPVHILTIEDPIEYVFEPEKAIISQREVNSDTLSWSMALRSALREDPDIVLVGEMRDFETIAAALTVAETGHLVFATLHTNTAAETINRIIDVFPSDQQGQVRQQLASSIVAVVSQRLIPATTGGVIPAVELMFANSAVRNLIRENKPYQIDSIIQTSSEAGMVFFEKYLMSLIEQGKITPETARENAFRPEEIKRLLHNR